MTDTADAWRLDRTSRNILFALILGMFTAAVSQTIVGPAMPRIIAELGGMDHYSWVATTALLFSAITTPIVGKLSDLFGRKRFYLGGLVVFMLGAVVSGLAPNFWILIAGRAVQGVGMGTLMPLSQTIIGDIIPPRQRGKYQGYMGAVFGVATVGGPLLGGAVTDAFGWRWLFFVGLPIGLVALVLIGRFMHLPHQRREVKVDLAGMVVLSAALVALLLATSWGGTTYPWASGVIIGLYAAGAVLTAVFVAIELRVEEPVLPLRLFRNPQFTLSNLAAFFLAMVMFGAMIYLPVYAQGVLGVGATASGLILMPLNLGQIILGIVTGWLITRTGRYKEFMVAGIVALGVGQWLLVRLTWQSVVWEVIVAMVVFGVGLGMVMQQYTLVVQNAVGRRDLGVATAATQFFRSVGSTVGIALFGTVLNAGLADAIRGHLPAGTEASASGLNAGSVLDPSVLAGLPPAVVDAVRHGLADRLHDVFTVGLPLVVVILLLTVALRPTPLRETVHTPEEAQREFLDTMSQSAEAGALVPSLSEGRAPRTRERVLGIQLGLLADEADREDRPLLHRAVAEVGGGDFERGRRLLRRTARMLATEDSETAASDEKYAVEVGELTARRGGLLSRELRADLAVAASLARRPASEVLEGPEVTVAEKYQAVDVSRLTVAGNELASALLVDLAVARPRGA